MFPSKFTDEASQLIKSFGVDEAEYAGNPIIGTGNFEEGAASYSPCRQPLEPAGSLLFLKIQPLEGNPETLLNSSTNEEFESATGGGGGGLVFNLSFVHEISNVADSKTHKLMKSKILLFFIDILFYLLN